MKCSLNEIVHLRVQDIRGEKHSLKPGERPWQVQRIVCKDGADLSVQASRTHYCNPRDNDGPYTHVEVGFPSVAPPESWREYAEEWERPTDTVYGYVPVELVQAFIDLHGGEA